MFRQLVPLMKLPHLVAAAALVAASAAAAAQRPATRPATSPLQPVGSVRDVMDAITVPASDAVFAAASEPPTTDEGWAKVRQQAVVVAETSNLLMLPGRAADQGEWAKWSRAQLDAAQAVIKATRAKNGDALSTAADALYETCAGCHKTYLK